MGNRIFFGLQTGEGQQLWTSDGTAAGTAPLGTFLGFINSQVNYPGLGAFFAAGTRLFFFAADSIHQQQILLDDFVAEQLQGLADWPPRARELGAGAGCPGAPHNRPRLG